MIPSRAGSESVERIDQSACAVAATARRSSAALRFATVFSQQSLKIRIVSQRVPNRIYFQTLHGDRARSAQQSVENFDRPTVIAKNDVNFGHPSRSEFTAFGTTVHRAMVIQSSYVPDVFISESTYQAVKGLTGVLSIVKKGGAIVLAASLTEGLGSHEFKQQLAEYEAKGGYDRPSPSDTCEMDEWQLVMLKKVLSHCRVKVVTQGLSAEVLRRCPALARSPPRRPCCLEPSGIFQCASSHSKRSRSRQRTGAGVR